ncbi:hypothetical protein BDP27DRAFT_1311226, partial [Rhodocollybia butyracea]
MNRSTGAFPEAPVPSYHLLIVVSRPVFQDLFKWCMRDLFQKQARKVAQVLFWVPFEV